MMKFKKALIPILMMTFLYQNIAFCLSNREFTLRPPSQFSKPTKEFIGTKDKGEPEGIASTKDEKSYQDDLAEEGVHDKEKQARIIGAIKLYLDSLGIIDKREIKIISYGCGPASILHKIKEELSQYNIVTIASDYSEEALDKARELDATKKEQYRIDEIRSDNLLELEKKESEYDVILLEDVIHEVFSFAKERVDGKIVDVEENKNELRRVFRELYGQLKLGGIMIIEDRIKPALDDEDELVRVELSGFCAEENLAEIFFGKESEANLPFSSVYIDRDNVTIEPQEDGTKILRCRIIDYLHFLSHMRTMQKTKNINEKGELDYRKWKIEREEVHLFFTRKEYENALTEAGFDSEEVNIKGPFRKKSSGVTKVLNPEAFEGIIDKERIGFEISTNIVAKKYEHLPLIISRYVTDNYKIVFRGEACPVNIDELPKVLAQEDFKRMISNIVFKKNFVESLGDLIIFFLKEERKSGIKNLEAMINRLIFETQEVSEGEIDRIAEFVGQLKMLCYESYSDTGSAGATLMVNLIKRFNANESMDVITKIIEVRRKLEYLQRGEEVAGLDMTVKRLRDKIDNLDEEIFQDNWAEKALAAIEPMIKEKLDKAFKIKEMDDKIAINEIQKIHKSQRAIIWDGEAHTRTTLDKYRRGARVYLGYLIIDGKMKILSSEIRVKNFLRTAAVLDIMHGMGLGGELLIEGIKDVIEREYTSVYWRVLDNNEPSNRLSNKVRDFVLRQRDDDTEYTQYVYELTQKAQGVFGSVEGVGIYCDRERPMARDYGDPRPSYKYEFQFVTLDRKRELVRNEGFNNDEIDNAVEVLDLIGIGGLKKVKQFIDNTMTMDRVKILELSKEIVGILEKDNVWVYNPSYYDFIFERKMPQDHVTYLETVKKFLKEDRESNLPLSERLQNITKQHFL